VLTLSPGESLLNVYRIRLRKSEANGRSTRQTNTPKNSNRTVHALRFFRFWP
jgi:hypothetical protein